MNTKLNNTQRTALAGSLKSNGHQLQRMALEQQFDLWDLSIFGSRLQANRLEGSKDVAQFNDDTARAAEEMERLNLDLLDVFSMFLNHPNAENFSTLIAAMAVHQDESNL